MRGNGGSADFAPEMTPFAPENTPFAPENGPHSPIPIRHETLSESVSWELALAFRVSVMQ